MMFVLLFLPIVSLIYCRDEDQQIIPIYINEELPISTILFTTANNRTYRLFDSGRNQNSFVFYNASNGQILLSQSLDRESLCSEHICSCLNCQLTIELIEWQWPYRLLKLLLNIEDINDHIPTFSSSSYRMNVIENVPIGYELPLETAVDADLGENSRISYELANSTDGPFEIMLKSNGGFVLRVIEPIDREEEDFYQYTLIAYDHGQPRQQSSTNISIQIDDMNDNSVILSQTYIELHISEHTPVGTELTSIDATDRDIGVNGKIHYSISNGFHFHIDESTGVLTLASPLDYEFEQFYRLIIQVRDLGENSLARFVTMEISVLDENDNTPQAFVTFVHPLVNDSVISIKESSPVGEILAHVSISDQDSGVNGEVSYEIEAGNEIIGVKVLDEKSFLLLINHLVDREDEHLNPERLIVKIFDHGKPSRSTTLHYQIDVVDQNDSPPIFDQSSMKCSFDWTRSQNHSINQSFFQVQAIDLDSGENGRISYSILPPHENLFTINNRGEVYHIEHLNESNYHLKIMAIDHGTPVPLNSTYDCFIRTSVIENAGGFVESRILFEYNHVILIISIILLLMIGISFYFIYQKCLKGDKTYHLYVSIPRQSLSIYDNQSDIHSSDKNLLSRTVQHSSPSSEDNSISQGSQSISITISTAATTCPSTEINCTATQLVREEKMDILAL